MRTMPRPAGPLVQVPCHICGTIVERPAWAINKGGRRRAFCSRECYYNGLRIHPDEARKRRQERASAWREANPERVRDYRRSNGLMANYGITPQDYDHMAAVQGHACAICRQVLARRLSVDHCHTTGRIRGLLCHKCNQGLGYFQDDPGLLDRAKEYLGGR